MKNSMHKKDLPARDMICIDELPRRCFVSHSYKDTKATEKLRCSVPDYIELVTFPRAEPNPKQAVSNEIIPKILDCPGLIYLTDEASSKSFWVSFERDYALRAGRDVFAYTSTNDSLRRDNSPPIPLEINVIFHQSDEDNVNRLISWMAKERHFGLNESNLRSRSGGFKGDIVFAMEELLFIGGVTLWLMGRGNIAIADKFYSEEFVDYLLECESDDWLADEWQKCLQRLHNEAGDQEWCYDGEEEYYDKFGGYYSKRTFIQDSYSNLNEVFARIDPDLSMNWRLLPWNAPEIIAEGGAVDLTHYRMIDLYEGTDGKEFNWNRIDDLIIALYERLLPRKRNHSAQ